MKTILLDDVAWDLVIDAAGNIAMASEPYSQAQDAASAIKLFDGELWYETTKGVPYWAVVLGKTPPLSLLKTKFVAAAMTVPGVTAAKCFISAIAGRRVTGQVQVSTASGQTAVAGF